MKTADTKAAVLTKVSLRTCTTAVLFKAYAKAKAEDRQQAQRWLLEVLAERGIKPDA
jgi:hypothetical protein